MAAESLTLVLADDSFLIREGLSRMFTEAGYRVAASYPDADSLIAELDETKPDIAVLDVRMPPSFRDEGVRAAIRIKEQYPEIGILLLSQYVESVYAQELLASSAGKVGYLLKDRLTSLATLSDAVERINSGGTVLDPEVIGSLITSRQNPLASLTPKEREVLEYMAQGLSNQGIADRLVVTLGAVEKHVTSLFLKLGITDTGTDHRRVLAVLAWLRG